ncbi:beta-phosphoglucomutase [Marinitoga sp. 1197]|uniref:HAD family hydrolase n=1 Tax=unclassified Marinitoga TaxID=2640159 RepID=UPI000640C65F|nr:MULTISPECIES: beta-phosphoglucomutase family hydrolase [unclassified Marinitoga]KLO22021.1 beta-phosphoglucomutase [Marinitoga sp. 1197]KLO24626.1 beta-phosphoglucomutase [Marinitoga sp. 1155]
MLEAVIFDMDGVITDTVPLHYKAWEKMFKNHGYEFNFNIYKEKVDGKPRIKGIASIASNENDEVLNSMAEEKQKYFLNLIENHPPKIFDDALYLINLLKKNSIKIAVASSSKNTKKILQSLNIYNLFDDVITGYDFKHGKPDPEIFLIASKRLNTKFQNCIVIEDAIEGINAGINAGMVTIGIARHGNEIELSHANLVVKSLNELNIEKLNILLQEAKI